MDSDSSRTGSKKKKNQVDLGVLLKEAGITCENTREEVKKLLNFDGSVGSSSPPKYVVEIKYDVKPTGPGHEATGAGDSGGGGGNDKDDHGGGGGGGQDKKKKKKKKGFVYCVICEDLISSEGYVDHLREMHQIVV